MKDLQFYSQEDGFSLVEVLVAVSIFCTVSLAFMLSFSSSLRLVGLSAESTKAMGQVVLLTEAVEHYGYNYLLAELIETPQDNYLLDGYVLEKYPEEDNGMLCYQLIDYDGIDSNNSYLLCLENSNIMGVEGIKVLVTVKGVEDNRLASLYSFIKKKL